MAATPDLGSESRDIWSATMLGAFDAKTHLPKLLDRVARGESITITRHGVPVAKLTPLDNCKHRPDPKALLAAFDAFRERHPLVGLTARELIEEGRRL